MHDRDGSGTIMACCCTVQVGGCCAESTQEEETWGVLQSGGPKCTHAVYTASAIHFIEGHVTCPSGLWFRITLLP